MKRTCPHRAARRRRATLLAAACAALLLEACAEPPPAGPPTAEELFRRELCGSCHGSAGKGTWMGPPLRELAQRWDRDSLQDFIRDPASHVERDERLSKLSRQFPNPMVGNQVLGKAERLLLADWLLER